MIYTIGNTYNYLHAFRKSETGKVYKLGKRNSSPEYPDGYPGGCAFKTIEDALAMINTWGYTYYSVFGLLADWDTDTKQNHNGGWNNLLIDAEIVPIQYTAEGLLLHVSQ